MIEIFEYGSVVQITAHAPFPLYLELGELVCSGPVRIFSMIHHVTEKRAFCSCCGHWLFLACCVCMCVWWLVMPMRPELTDCAGQKALCAAVHTDRWPDTT